MSVTPCPLYFRRAAMEAKVWEPKNGWLIEKQLAEYWMGNVVEAIENRRMVCEMAGMQYEPCKMDPCAARIVLEISRAINLESKNSMRAVLH